MNSRLAGLCLAGLCLAVEFGAVAQGPPVPIKVEIVAADGGASGKLRIRLTNASSKNVTAYSSKLPWGTRNSMIVAAVKLTGTNEALGNTPVIDDPPPGEVTLKPGETLAGEIDLAARFYQSWQGARGKPVLIFWSYQLQTVDGHVSNRVNGELEITPR